MTKDAPSLEDFPARTTDKLRYGDTDRQGHVNNAVYSTFFETGRVEMLHAGDVPPPEGKAFVIARVTIDFRREVNWPGEVEIGTGVAAIGNSSIRLRQALFQNGRICASAESVIVLMDETTRRSTPLPEGMRAKLAARMIAGEPAAEDAAG
ncbi:thioesterase family protein [Aurantimonas sp. 22II-16-19i]|uniref:acyl-CoA thioesterase n=1 Tax=Aurantimonas sp. 22II-16-19i TaxID=1317114 RepID=UPI0009F7CD2E|nr:thioesterase family protein [Aurantimonas sp. 22II-16-19i]ORE98138.1 thioesterase superfamily protein [Aurantimonas sp. 22II-16-19i]